MSLKGLSLDKGLPVWSNSVLIFDHVKLASICIDNNVPAWPNLLGPFSSKRKSLGQIVGFWSHIIVISKTQKN